MNSTVQITNATLEGMKDGLATGLGVAMVAYGIAAAVVIFAFLWARR